nr:RagB/SusD family nutrient uptake outer membrane protein [Riemerella anatipestifer]
MSRNFSSTNIRQNPKAMNKLLYSKFPSTDVRTQVVDPTGKHLSLSLPSNFAKYPYTSQKFLAVGTGDSRMDVPYMRAAEMYLIEAEALARLGKEPESKVVFTEFSKNRNPAYVATTATGEAYINEILDSRRIELWGEGFRFLDLKRLNQPLNRTGSNHNSVVVNNVFEVSAGDSRWTFLIPRRELNANPLIKQN